MASEDGQESVFPAISPSRRISAKTFFCARLAVRSTFFCNLSWSNFVLLAISRRFLLSFFDNFAAPGGTFDVVGFFALCAFFLLDFCCPVS